MPNVEWMIKGPEIATCNTGAERAGTLSRG
jgi:hypothetical protein